jgi:hypothetical protein
VTRDVPRRVGRLRLRSIYEEGPGASQAEAAAARLRGACAGAGGIDTARCPDGHPPPPRIGHDPADRVDQYGRLLRKVVRLRDGVNLNIRLVAVGAAAPYFYRHRRANMRAGWKL